MEEIGLSDQPFAALCGNFFREGFFFRYQWQELTDTSNLLRLLRLPACCASAAAT
jgi:hypothetical protein